MRIKAIVETNTFGWGESGEGSKSQKGTGIWPIMSRFNHSCIMNCIREYAGDLLVLRAAVDIKKDEELTISYLPTQAVGIGKIKSNRFTCWGFTCNCDRCKYSASNIANLEKLAAHIEALKKNQNVNEWKKFSESLMEGY
jgi:hypothetical protein